VLFAKLSLPTLELIGSSAPPSIRSEHPVHSLDWTTPQQKQQRVSLLPSRSLQPENAAPESNREISVETRIK
jgi:hypothetical protein